MSSCGGKVRTSASAAKRRAALLCGAVLSLSATPAFPERYQIPQVTYSLEKTREGDLRRTVPVDTRRIFESREELDSYLDDLAQRLMNTRAFQSVEISETGAADEADETAKDAPDGGESVTMVPIRISAADSKHLLILPYPKYDSNDGLVLKIKARNVNFLGTMSVLDAGVFAGIKEDEETGDQNLTLGAELSYRLPFMLGPLLGSWNNNLDLQYTHGVNELEFWSGTGLTFERPLGRVSLVLDLSEQANRVPEYGQFGDTQHFTSDISFSVPVRILDIDRWGFVTWTPFVDTRVSYDKDGISRQNDDLAGPVISAGQSLSTARVNWHGNLRTGVSAEAGHSIGYDFMQREVEPRFFGEVRAFKGMANIGINARLSAFITKSNRGDVGALIRGARDKQKYMSAGGRELKTPRALKTPSALVLNIDIPVHIITTRWLDWTSSLFGADSRITRALAWTDKFNFELQMSPFIDIALTKNEITGRLFSPKDGWYTCGAELLLFPERWRGIVIRASVGFDIGRAVIARKTHGGIDTSWREDVKEYEIYLGIGLHY